MLDEPPLPLGGPAGVALAGGRGVEFGKRGAGTMSAWSSTILSLVAMPMLLQVNRSCVI
jgi:hypothetical protein